MSESSTDARRENEGTAVEAGTLATQRFSEDAEDSYPKLVAHFTVQLASINAARSELIRIHRAGMIEDEVMHNLERDLDVEEMSVRLQLATA